jgi:hypothetical protein
MNKLAIALALSLLFSSSAVFAVSREVIAPSNTITCPALPSSFTLGSLDLGQTSELENWALIAVKGGTLDPSSGITGGTPVLFGTKFIIDPTHSDSQTFSAMTYSNDTGSNMFPIHCYYTLVIHEQDSKGGWTVANTYIADANTITFFQSCAISGKTATCSTSSQ